MTTDLKGIDPLPSGAFRFRVQHLGEIISGTAPTPELAAQLRDEVKRQIIDGELVAAKGAACRDLGPRFLASRSGNRDIDNDESRWHRHLARADWARLPPAAVTRNHGTAWLKALKRKVVEPPPNVDPKRRAGKRVARLGRSVRHHCLVLARRFFEWCLEQPGSYALTGNPFAGLTVEREDGDEEGGYQEEWYLDATEQPRFLGLWDTLDDLDQTDRDEKWIAQFGLGSGVREGEQWCLHLTDVHVDEDEERPRVVVRFGSWDYKKQRYRAPKGRKGEKKKRTVYLFGLDLDAMRTWLKILPTYCPKNPLGLVFPTERGARRTRPPRSWTRVVEAFGVVPRIGKKVWWHLLRHSCASSLVSGWWGIRWWLEDISKRLGHTDVRTTQMYAHLAPSVAEETAQRAQAAYLARRHAAVTGRRGVGERSPRKTATSLGHARSDSNRRLPASKACPSTTIAEEIARRDGLVTAIRHALEEIAAERVVVTAAQLRALEIAFDFALNAYAELAAEEGVAS